MIQWDDEGENSLMLFTVAEFEKLPDGVELESIDGSTAVKGTDEIDLDIGFGHIAYGVRNPINHKDKHTILVAVLAAEENMDKRV